MPRLFHNLDGVLRDLAASRRAGPEGEGDAYARWTEFVSCVEDALEEIEGPGDADDAEDGDADAPDELAGSQLELRHTDDGGAGGHDARGENRSAPASTLDAVLDRLDGPLRAQAELELDALRRDAMAGTQPRDGELRKVGPRGKKST